MFPDDQVKPGLEATLASELSQYLAGCVVGEKFVVPAADDICSSLELFLPQKLRTRYPEWIRESLDGIFVAEAIKTAENAVTLLGTCVLISDQTVTPFMARFELNAVASAFEFIQIKVGESGDGRLGISGPPCNSREAHRVFESLVGRISKISWVYSFETTE